MATPVLLINADVSTSVAVIIGAVSRRENYEPDHGVALVLVEVLFI